MKDKDPYAFLDDIKAGIDAERDVVYSVTPERGEQLMKEYPITGTISEGYEKFTPEEFFDG